MAYFKHALMFLLSCLILIVITGCLMQLNQTPEPIPGFSPDLPPAQYASAIENLQAVAENKNDPSASQSAHLHLAWLYSSYKNPARDYRQALERIEQYLVTPPETNDRYDAKNLQSLLTVLTVADSKVAATEKQRAVDLKRISAESKGWQAQVEKWRTKVAQLEDKANRLETTNRALIEQNALLGSNNSELASYNKSLLEKNKALEETIEKLKTLEMQLEQKRKSFK